MHAQWHAVARTPPVGPLATHVFNCLSNLGYPVPNSATIRFQLLLARSASTDRSSQSGKVVAASRQPRQQIIELRELHLELSFTRMRVRSEDVENMLCAVSYGASDALLHIAKLHRRQVVIYNN